MKTEPLFYVARDEEQVAGPYDLVQMAGLLRKKMITADSLTRLEGEHDWEPFGNRRQFIIAKEMPADAVSTRVIELNEAEQASDSPIPLPSKEFVVQLVAMTLAVLVSGVLAFFVAWLAPSLGLCLLIAGGIAAIYGTGMIYVKLLDEDYLTLLLVFFVPFYDVYYFLANFDKYLPYFCARYFGAIVAAAALAGIKSSGASDSDLIKTLFGT